MVTYSTILLCFLLRKEGIVRERRILRGRGRESRPTLDIFKEKKERERGGGRGKKKKKKEGGEEERAQASPLKQILVILALVIYRILKKTLVL